MHLTPIPNDLIDARRRNAERHVRIGQLRKRQVGAVEKSRTTEAPASVGRNDRPAC